MDTDFDLAEPNDGDAQVCAHVLSTMHYDESVVIPSGKDAEAMAMCYASKKHEELEKFPMSPRLIAKEQQKDKNSSMPWNQFQGIQ